MAPESPHRDDAIRAAMSQLAGESGRGAVDVEAVLAGVTAAAVDLIDGIDYADVLLIDHDEFTSMASTAQLPCDLDDVQQRLREGPCLEAATSEVIIRSTDLRSDARWPGFAAEAVARGVLSMLSFQLFTRRGGAGALNLLGREAHQFSVEAEALGAMLATHAAIALESANTRKQFESALTSRDNIGQAKGILMERFSVDAVEAFELLKRLSQESNTPLRIVALRVIATR